MAPSPTISALTDYVHAHLPLAGAMGVEIEAASGQHVRMLAPLSLNSNHEHTAFGGSISSLGLLAAWSLLWCRLREEGTDPVPRLVVSHSQTRYIRPIDDHLLCTCEHPDLGPWFAELKRAGTARQELRAHVMSLADPTRVAATVDALFVAGHRKEAAR